jgi:beta-1,4-mannosyl-glycoprotein beta-1,4-N-acetylglucosaminyltransferase
LTRKVVDAVEFSSELDLLEIRMNELYDTVSYFLVSESTQTHTGQPKPLYFEENKDRFAKFQKKIIHQVITDTPNNYMTLTEDEGKDELHKIAIRKVMHDQFWDHGHLPYSRDAFEKESLIRAMGILEPSDIVMFSDADEIPRKESVQYVLDNFNPEQIYNLEQNHYWFYLNCLRPDKWMGNTILTFEKFKTLSVCELRKYRRGIIVQNAGWHFSFMNKGDAVRRKIQSYGEQSINRPDVTNDMKAFVNDCIVNNHDFYYHPVNFTITKIDETYPEFVCKNQDKFAELIR